jgi:serine/threonine protein kinase/Tfp pilus assembly protein PilF
MTEERTALRLTMGKYEVRCEIGRGGMGVVYEAYDPLIHRRVALKTLVSELFTGPLAPTYLSRLRREAEAAGRLTHPNIVAIYDYGEESVPNSAAAMAYIAMEFVEGRELASYLSSSERFSTSVVVRIMSQLLDALDYSHKHGVVHRDIKPSNLIVLEDGSLKVADFGIARIESSTLTQAGTVMGSPSYMSPEQFLGQPVDGRSDLYSAGVVLYELLTGEVPFSGSFSSVMQRALNEQPCRPSVLNVLAPTTADALLARALAKKPTDRFQSAAEFKQAMLDALSDAPAQRARGRLPFALGSRRLQAAVAAGALALLGGLVLMFFVRHQAAQPSVTGGGNGPGPFTSDAHSVAVLPFSNLSGDPQQEYFSDGMSEELIDALSQISALQVAARQSSFSFKGKNTDIATIARTLHVATILDGSIRRSGNVVRITAELINAATGFHMWSHTYDLPFTDVLKVQAAVATAVTQQLAIKLGAHKVVSLPGGTQNAEANDAYLRGLRLLKVAHASMKPEDERAALAAFERATTLDPNFVLAYLNRAAALMNLVDFISSDPATRTQVRAQAREAVARAIALAPELGRSHLGLAELLASSSGDFEAALPEFERSMALSPNDAPGLSSFATFALQIGRPNAAMSAIERAIRLDPLNDDRYVAKAQVFYSVRQYSEALDALKIAEILGPRSHYTGVWRALILYTAKRMEEALRECEPENAPLEQDDRLMCLAHVYHALGRTADAERALAKLKELDGDAFAYNYATVYAQWGDKPTALQWLQRADELADPSIAYLIIDPLLDPLRDEPQFDAIVRRHHFPPRPADETQGLRAGTDPTRS